MYTEKITETETETETVVPWTYEDYWNIVMGPYRSAADVSREFDLSSSPTQGHGSIDEWLGHAEVEAWTVGDNEAPLPKEWADFHARAVETLMATLGDVEDLMTAWRRRRIA